MIMIVEVKIAAFIHSGYLVRYYVRHWYYVNDSNPVKQARNQETPMFLPRCFLMKSRIRRQRDLTQPGEERRMQFVSGHY